MKRLLPASILLVFCFFLLVACTPEKEEITEDIQYDMELSLQENVLTGKEEISFTNIYEEGLTQAVFHLYPNCYAQDAVDKAYNGILSEYGGIEIQKVTGEDITYSCSENKEYLLVLFPAKEKNETISLHIDFAVTVPTCVLRLGKANGNIILTNFYPQLSVYKGGFLTDEYTTTGDPFMSEEASYTISFTCDTGYVVASSTKAVSKAEEEGNVTYFYQGDNIRDYAFVLSKNFSVLTEKAGETEINYFYLQDSKAEEHIALQKKAFETFTETFGSCGLTSYSVVCLPFEYSGMEYSGLAVLSSYLGEDIDETILHETAHQWWYHLVGNDGVRQSVLDEGLTSFTAVYYYALIGDEQTFSEKISGVKNTYTQYETLQKRRQTGTKLNLDGSLYDYTSYQYTMLMYYKGCMLFNNLYELYGKEKMSACLRSYAETYAHKTSDIDGFISVASSVFKTDVKGLIYGWINGNATVTTFRGE